MSASMTVNEKAKKTSDVTKTCHRPARQPYPRLARQAASIGFRWKYLAARGWEDA